MHADIARHAFELLRQLNQGLDFVVVLDALGQLRLGGNGVFFLVVVRQIRRRILDGDRLAGLVRNQLADAVAEGVAQVQHAAHVSDGGTRGHGAEGGDLAHGVTTVLVLHVVDHAIAVGLAEVDVEVGHGHPLRVQETLEQQVVFKRIQVRDF